MPTTHTTTPVRSRRQCQDDAECFPDDYPLCIAGKCAANKLGAGAACGTEGDCKSGTCARLAHCRLGCFLDVCV